MFFFPSPSFSSLSLFMKSCRQRTFTSTHAAHKSAGVAALLLFNKGGRSLGGASGHSVNLLRATQPKSKRAAILSSARCWIRPYYTHARTCGFIPALRQMDPVLGTSENRQTQLSWKRGDGNRQRGGKATPTLRCRVTSLNNISSRLLQVGGARSHVLSGCSSAAALNANVGLPSSIMVH